MSPAYVKWYKTKQWKSMSKHQLRQHKLCQCPHHRGKDASAVATVADHVIPHKGNRKLFWDRRNLQSLTKTCHDKYKQSQERGGKGFDQGCDVDGNPLNLDAVWYAA